MSLAQQIEALSLASSQCRTCAWYNQQDHDVQVAFDSYIDRQKALEHPVYKPLWELCCQNGLEVVSKSFRDHIQNHHQRVRVS